MSHIDHITPIADPLYVVTAISNFQRFRSRYQLYRDFEKMCADSGAILYTVELALGERPHEISHPGSPRHIRLRTRSEIWQKENLLNLAIARLPADWKYVAWVDADVAFARPDWVQETIQQLQHYKIVQMWSHAQDVSYDYDLGPGMCLKSSQGMMFSHIAGAPYPQYLADYGDPYSKGTNNYLWHTGYAWAARREALDDLGGLGDIAILGSGDHHMACALVGKVDRTINAGTHPTYGAYWLRWQERAERYIQGNVGYVPGLLIHHWHGPKRARGYTDRWKLLVEHQYDCTRDLKYDSQGVLTLTDRNRDLRDGIKEYFRSRNEDSIDF